MRLFGLDQRDDYGYAGIAAKVVAKSRLEATRFFRDTYDFQIPDPPYIDVFEIPSLPQEQRLKPGRVIEVMGLYCWDENWPPERKTQ